MMDEMDVVSSGEVNDGLELLAMLKSSCPDSSSLTFPCQISEVWRRLEKSKNFIPR